MSDQPQGPGWWQASDDRWYAPELRPYYFPSVPVVGPPGIAPPLPPFAMQMTPVVAPTTPAANPQATESVVIGPTHLSSSNAPRRWWVWAIPVIAACLALGIVLPLTVAGTSTTTSTTSPQANRAAESNLTNALTEAKALYQVNQSYSAAGHPFGANAFTMQAPEFTWTTGSCSAASCVSLQVMDVSTDTDAQGVALAAFSSETSTCWYAMDLETTPVLIVNDPTAFQSTTDVANVGVSAGGDFYARSPVDSTPTSCSASLVLHPHQAHWGTTYVNAGALS